MRALDRRESQRARRVDAGSAADRAAGRACAARSRWPPRSRSPPDFPQRDLIIFLTFAVIFVTLVLQGLTLPPLIRAARRRRRRRARSARSSRRGWSPTKAALARIDELGGEEWTRDDTIERMRGAVRVPQAPAGGARRARSRTTATRTARSPTRRSCARCWRRSAREIVRLRNEGDDLQRGHAPARARARPGGRAARDLMSTPRPRRPAPVVHTSPYSFQIDESTTSAPASRGSREEDGRLGSRP